VLVAGTLPPNPQELLSRNSFAALTPRLDQHFDVVLYDVAPFSVGADALAIASRVGGVLVVARKNHTRIEDINALREQCAIAARKSSAQCW
jgi:Mrp family chromosome partitioning ATPase